MPQGTVISKEIMEIEMGDRGSIISQILKRAFVKK